MSEQSAPAAPTRGNLRLLCGLALIAWLLNLYFYTGYYMSDDAEYLDGIQRLSRLDPLDPTDIAHMRLALIAPASVVYALFGSTTLTILSYTIYHPLLVFVAYAVGRRAFAPGPALLGAAMVAVSPIFYVYGGAILPDNCLAVWLGVVLWLTLRTLQEAKAGKLTTRAELAFWLVTGGVTGVAYSAKEPGIVIAVPLAISILCLRLGDGARWRALWCAVAYGSGVLLFMALETLLLRLLSDTWAVRLLAGAGNPQSVEAYVKRIEEQGLWPLERLRFWYDRNERFYEAGLFVLLLTNLVALPLLGRRGEQPSQRRYVAVLLAFWLWLFAYLCFGSTNFSRYLPPPIQHARYFSVCLVAAVPIAAAVLWRLTELLVRFLPQHRPWLPWLIRTLPVALTMFWGLAMLWHFEPRAGQVYRAAQAKAALAAFEDARRLYPERPVVLSPYLARRLEPLLAARGCSACGRIVTHVNSLDELPERPFTVLISNKANKDSLGPVITKLKKKKKLMLEAVGDRRYRAPSGRWNELKAGLYPLFGELSEPSWEVATSRHEVRLYLVSDAPTTVAQ